MKRNYIILALLATLCGGAMAQATDSIDTSQFVAVYDYECRTQDDEGGDVTDKMSVVVQVGKAVVKSMPFSVYAPTVEPSIADLAREVQEAYMHMPTVWTELERGQTIVREYIFPHEYEGYEPTPEIAWTLLDDTVTVCGYHCHLATGTFRGVEWQACYTEDIPSSVGPWRLHGLPGLIVKAECAAHTFSLAALRQEALPITAPEQRPDVLRMEYAKLQKFKSGLYGSRHYAKNPTYYVPNVMGSVTDMTVINEPGQQFVLVNGGRPLLETAHVYQPLERM